MQAEQRMRTTLGPSSKARHKKSAIGWLDQTQSHRRFPRTLQNFRRAGYLLNHAPVLSLLSRTIYQHLPRNLRGFGCLRSTVPSTALIQYTIYKSDRDVEHFWNSIGACVYEVGIGFITIRKKSLGICGVSKGYNSLIFRKCWLAYSTTHLLSCSDRKRQACRQLPGRSR